MFEMFDEKYQTECTVCFTGLALPRKKSLWDLNSGFIFLRQSTSFKSLQKWYLTSSAWGKIKPLDWLKNSSLSGFSYTEK